MLYFNFYIFTLLKLTKNFQKKYMVKSYDNTFCILKKINLDFFKEIVRMYILQSYIILFNKD